LAGISAALELVIFVLRIFL